MTGLEDVLALYDYEVPEGAIAQVPAEPRESAQLLVYNRAAGAVRYDTYAHLARYLPEGALLVFNDTKVIPARLYGTVPTGGKVEILFTTHDKALLNRNVQPGTEIAVESYSVLVHERVGKEFRVEPSWQLHEHTAVLHRLGHTPIPPYIKHSPLHEAELRERYQTTFADKSGSVAAPTASLHFSPALMQTLRGAGHELAFVTLHVGLGTFAPLTDAHLQEGTLHTEHYSIDDETYATLQSAKASGRPIIAVGTTVARTLETLASTGKHAGTTDIFIKEGYQWQLVDGLITNFHVPRSSLMMLVATLTGRERLLELYRDALAHDFRFFSFGDGMLIT